MAEQRQTQQKYSNNTDAVWKSKQRPLELHTTGLPPTTMDDHTVHCFKEEIMCVNY